MTEETQGTWGEYLAQEFRRIFGGFRLPSLPKPPKLRKKKKYAHEKGGKISAASVTKIGNMTIYDDWGGRARIVDIGNGVFVAQVPRYGGWQCIDTNGKHTWNYGADTQKWCQHSNYRQAKTLVNKFLLNEETARALKQTEAALSG
jgi:hypothetical protein